MASQANQDVKARRENARPSGFFAMPRGELVFLVALVAASTLGFLTMKSSVTLAGMALFGWWMAALMFLGPLAALILLWLGPGKRKEDS
ncbi:MAG: hypothetical protein JSV08_04885 [Acidobacteriota bacterium]|nr:MAG: hypothetical protein JSV08_04885 [Acidobacteriota bacterium]